MNWEVLGIISPGYISLSLLLQGVFIIQVSCEFLVWSASFGSHMEMDHFPPSSHLQKPLYVLEMCSFP